MFNPLHCGWSTYFAFWLPKLAVSLLAASPLLFTRTSWWSIVWMMIIDLWIIANFIYFRANSLLLSSDAIRMASNLNGFGSSVLLYLDIHVWIFLLLTTLYTAIWFVCRKSVSSWKTGVCMSCVAVICSLTGGWCNYLSFAEDMSKKNKELEFRLSWLNPFVIPEDIAPENWLTEHGQFNYIMNHSIVAYSVNMVVEGVKLDKLREKPAPRNQHEEAFLQNLPDIHRSTDLIPDKNLILILVESFESWTLQMTCANGEEVTPCINRFRQNHPHLYAHRITSQVKQGMSGDGQMIVNTGLLPISSGAACLLYAHNTYPNFAQFFASSALINPVKNTWNKTDAARNYGYRKLIEPEDNIIKYNQTSHRKFWIDNTIFDEAGKTTIQMSDNMPFCNMILTISTHLPFDLYDKRFDIPLPDDMPQAVRNYLCAMHYSDYHIGNYLNLLADNNLLQNSVVIITGDHTVFHNIDFQELQEWAKSTNLSIAHEPNYCPLIMFSPDITENISVVDTCYQMDIYPTILSAVGLRDYPWHGFGKDLLNTSSDTPLPSIQHDQCKQSPSVQEAYSLSDLIIRSNAFAK
ncbi:MAG: LTA synthase family protein [Paludibacteraceae bacterium]|nr:LTA synthase family protein [Paludibacteraceae bacterium]